MQSDAATAQTYYDAIDRTWPAFATTTSGPFTLRDGRGGGKRVSAATLRGDLGATARDIEAAAVAMHALSQAPLFMVRDGDHDLDRDLDALGYRIIDPVVVYSSPTAPLVADDGDDLAAIPCETPLAAMRDLWARGGIGAARLDVMARAQGPKTHLLGRRDNRIAAVAFLACDGDIGMMHALEVAPEVRKQGIGRRVTLGAAEWCRRNGATTLAMATTLENTAARALYNSMGFTAVCRYHYRILPR